MSNGARAGKVMDGFHSNVRLVVSGQTPVVCIEVARDNDEVVRGSVRQASQHVSVSYSDSGDDCAQCLPAYITRTTLRQWTADTHARWPSRESVA